MTDTESLCKQLQNHQQYSQLIPSTSGSFVKTSISKVGQEGNTFISILKLVYNLFWIKFKLYAIKYHSKIIILTKALI